MTSDEKKVATTLERYGVDNVAKLDWVQEKRRQTFESKKDVLIFYQEPRVHNVCGDDLEVYVLNKDVCDKWLNTYHPFGASRGSILSLGLVSGDVMYCVMTFKKSRNKQYFAELSRLWMLPTYNIINGYDRLSSFASELGIYNVVAYVNMSFENHLDYESIGMKYVRDLQPTKWWIRDFDKMSDASRRQSKIKQDDLISGGWRPVYDCGSRVYAV